MAEILVSALAQTVLGNINSVILQEIGLTFGLKDEIKNLKRIFKRIQLVLEDAELKQRKNKGLQNWLMQLKHAAYDADNILDQINTEELRRRLNSKRGISFLSSPNHLLFRSKMAHKVKDVRKKLDIIAKEGHDFDLNEGVVVNRFGVTLESRQTSSLVNELEIYGRNDEKEMIIGELLDSKHEQENLSIYAIWGMGGLGKTTLAQLVYNDVRTEKHFELRIWVCVSDDFSIPRLVRAILESIQVGCGSNVSEWDPLQRLLQEKLRGRKFLLVLDDVWNEDHNLWDELKQVLKCGSKGSMIIVTTRIEKIAIMMSTITSHNIGYLSKGDSWSLFKQRAFTGREEDESLVAIGKLIVNKCGGVPLAIKVLGGLMRFKSDESEWLAVKESEIWQLSDDENRILPALRLSYDNLLPEMRQCFAYCCIFPKDYKMEENELIQLWMANGFIPSEGQTDMYRTGHLIFKELVWRSFLQDVKIYYSGNTTCKMHDLMHDLAQSVMRHETYILQHNEVPRFPQMLRHLGYDSSSTMENKLKLPIDDSLCSIIVHGRQYQYLEEDFASFFSKQQYLRVFDMNYCRGEQKLPSLVCKLKYLRYLVLSCDGLELLPESVTSLLNLQTLKLTASYCLLELPKSLNLMKNLWFLEIEDFYSLICTPPRLRDLTNLHSLSIFIVGQDASQQIDQLKELNLGGKLSIQGLENVRDFDDAKGANLMRKRNLTSLSLSWKDGIKDNSAQHFEEVLEGLQPHGNLIKIFIKSYDGSRFPNWLSTLASKNLNEISLEYCGRCEHLPPLGKLPSLKRLRLEGMNSIKHLGTEWEGDGERSFPALRTLTISEMPNLEDWTISDSFSSLTDLDIKECPKLSGLPLLPTLRSLNVSQDSVALVPSIRFLTSLTYLELYKIPNLDLSNVLNNLSSLKTLTIEGCSTLEFIPHGLQNLNSLETLSISTCHSLISFPAAILENMSSLTSLTLQSCKKLDPLSGPLQRTTILQELQIIKFPELKHLPESMQQLSALAKLYIHSCEGLYSLPNWFGSLQSLSRVDILDCKNLKSLPDGFQSLKSLRELRIEGCPDLEKRCEKLKGADWPKISHIPIIRISKKIIQNLDE